MKIINARRLGSSINSQWNKRITLMLRRQAITQTRCQCRILTLILVKATIEMWTSKSVSSLSKRVVKLKFYQLVKTKVVIARVVASSLVWAKKSRKKKTVARPQWSWKWWRSSSKVMHSSKTISICSRSISTSLILKVTKTGLPLWMILTRQLFKWSGLLRVTIPPSSMLT